MRLLVVRTGLVVASVVAVAAVIVAAPRIYADPASILFEPWLLGAALIIAYTKLCTLVQRAASHLRPPK